MANDRFDYDTSWCDSKYRGRLRAKRGPPPLAAFGHPRRYWRSTSTSFSNRPRLLAGQYPGIRRPPEFEVVGAIDDHEIRANSPVPLLSQFRSNIRDSNSNFSEIRATITLLKLPLRLS